VIAGITNDPVFGPLVAFGSGGVMVELLDDVVFRVLPMTDRDAAAMIRETRAFRLLRGFRGSAPADVAALERLLLALGALAEAEPRIAQACSVISRLRFLFIMWQLAHDAGLLVRYDAPFA
jgi:hypothetical protein